MTRDPVHVIYGGAHLFRSDAARKLGALALKSLDQFAPDAATFGAVFGLSAADAVYERVVEKLRREPVEDLRIDFEDGYGHRTDAEEDKHAFTAATQLAAGYTAGALPPFTGIRVKAFQRGLRTLRIFLDAAGTLPPNFVVTYPKAASVAAVEAFVAAVPEPVKIELMIETPQAIPILRALLGAARGRCVAAHFGAYDYTAALGITAAHQHLLHPACQYARSAMQVAFAGTGVRLSDGGTNILPLGADAAAVHAAWKLHYDHIRHSLSNAFYQSWDLHPAQLVSRYAAVYAFFLEGLADAGIRLRNFIDVAAQATRVGAIFDDAATGQGLLNFFVRAVNCGAITVAEAEEKSGLREAELQSGSFEAIVSARRG